MTKFFALDVETANCDSASICQIGVVEFDHGQVINTWSTLIDPEDEFDPTNIYIHGITPEAVAGAPTFDQIHPQLQTRLKNQIVVTHTPFDITALRRDCQDYELPELDCAWLDSARIVRRHWEDLRYAGYGLQNVAARLGIQYQAHDALEDARAAGLVVLHVISESGMSLDEWHKRAYLPISPRYYAPVKMDGNPDGPLYGESIVFTGSISIPRPEAAQLAAQSGCTVQDAVTRKTTLVVVGVQDMDKLAGYEKSRKQRTAEELIKKGYPLRIITEHDFYDLVAPKTKSFFSL